MLKLSLGTLVVQINSEIANVQLYVYCILVNLKKIKDKESNDKIQFNTFY